MAPHREGEKEVEGISWVEVVVFSVRRIRWGPPPPPPPPPTTWSFPTPQKELKRGRRKEDEIRCDTDEKEGQE